MGRIEKTVFISYRRTNLPWALAIYQELMHYGYDVFFDYQSIDSGNFEKVILENIKSRAHFLIILTPSALERCKEPGDWLRREIETAMDEKRNIVPLMLESFDFGSPIVVQALTGKLASLSNYNGLRIYSEYFYEAMEKLRQKYLNVSLETALYPLTDTVQKQNKLIESNKRRHVEQTELTALELRDLGDKYSLANNYREAIRCFTEAILLKPDLAEAYIGRGLAREAKRNQHGAIEDYSKAIALKPDFAEAYRLRGALRQLKDNLNDAIEDYNKAIHIKPSFVEAYKERGIILAKTGKLREAIDDFQRAMQLQNESPDSIEQESQKLPSKELLDQIKPASKKAPARIRTRKAPQIRIFLSHVSQDRIVVKEVYDRLIADGYDAWLDKEKLLPGQDWDIEIEKAIENTDVVIVFISKRTATKNGYIQKEMRKILYVAETKPEDDIFIIPIRIEDCNIPRRLQKLHCIDYFPVNQKDWAYERLCESISGK